MTKILIDAGRSSHGWSRIGQFMQCPQKFAYDQHLDIDLIPASALTRGSMGHAIQAHQHAIWGCEQGGVWVDDQWHEDASVFYEPELALHAWVDRFDQGEEFTHRMLETFRRYLRKHPEPPGRVLAVEYPITGVLGWRTDPGKDWGLHAVSLAQVRKGLTTIDPMEAFDGGVIHPTPLNCPNHVRHGQPIIMTRRCDMVIEDRAKRVWIWDHKHQAMVQPGRSVDAYAIDGGFAVFRMLGKQIWPKFSGLMLNLIQTQEPWRVARPTVPTTPHRDNHLPELIWRAEHELAQLEVEKLDPWKWPKAMHEVACYGRYGPCSGLKLCQFGPSALEDMD